jgi:hypothetical protein
MERAEAPQAREFSLCGENWGMQGVASPYGLCYTDAINQACPRSSMAEQFTLNETVGGSSPPAGIFLPQIHIP